jgi:hypothetical protein
MFLLLFPQYVIAITVVWAFIPETAPLLQTKEEVKILLAATKKIFADSVASSSGRSGLEAKRVSAAQALEVMKDIISQFKPNGKVQAHARECTCMHGHTRLNRRHHYHHHHTIRS